jgi:FlaA1/EpsC-like NDP-sugar epimerase
MRRRLSSAAFPLHRHSLPQLAVDGVMVALAYELAYRLRFDAGIPHRYQLLLNRTLLWTVAASMVIFVLFRLYQKWWRYVTGRDYVSIAQAIVIATLSLPAFVATTHPVKVR